MSFSVVNDSSDIDAAQEQLERSVRAAASVTPRVKIGWRGGNELREVAYVAGHDLWFASKKIPGSRWWNGFGLGDPDGGQPVSIVAEVNPSLDGSKKSAGAFLRDERGIWLAHSGRVGGGRKGIGKRSFLDAFTGAVERVEGHDYVVIGRIEAKDFLDKLAAFVRAVKEFKAGVGGEPSDEIDDGQGLYADDDETWGLDEVLEGVEATSRIALLEWLADVLKQAHAQSASCWAVTRRDGPRLRLLVGGAVAFEIGRGRVGVGIHVPSLPVRVDANADADWSDFAFTRIDGGVFRSFSLEAFLGVRGEIRPAAMRFVELATAAYRNSPYARHHVPELLDEIGDALGVILPRPTHSEVEVATSFWKIAPGEKAKLWEQCREGGYIAIGWDELGELSGLNRNGFEERRDETIRDHPEYGWKRKGVDQVWRFVNIPAGSRIVANDGTRRVLGIGTVTGPYRYVRDGKPFAHRLPVPWDDVRERAVHFQPTDAQLEYEEKVAEPVGGRVLRVQPYMLKFRRMVVPAILAERVKGDSVAGRVQVKFGDGQVESLKWSAQSTATQLLFKGAFWEWFSRTFKAGDELELRIEGEDPPVLSIAPLGASESAAKLPRPVTYSVVAVRPDWTDNRGLLGYYNPITREYQTTPFLRLLLTASDEWESSSSSGRAPMPYFVVLDEMNLARVEHYFSDFLSCMESGEPLHLHDDALVAEGGSESGEAVPMQIGVPRNLFFTGTVNVDETTYMFSPKVLDRAFVLEFNDVDLEGLATPAGDDVGEDTGGLRLIHFEGALDIREKASREDYQQVSLLAGRAVHRALSSLNARLSAEHRHFGYRVANEIARFIGLAVAQAGRDPEVVWEALDVAILAKVLPKIHGTQQEVEDALARLLAFAVDVDSDVTTREAEASWAFAGSQIRAREGDRVPRLPRSAAKLWRMLRRARLQGYVSFIE